MEGELAGSLLRAGKSRTNGDFVKIACCNPPAMAAAVAVTSYERRKDPAVPCSSHSYFRLHLNFLPRAAKVFICFIGLFPATSPWERSNKGNLLVLVPREAIPRDDMQVHLA